MLSHYCYHLETIAATSTSPQDRAGLPSSLALKEKLIDLTVAGSAQPPGAAISVPNRPNGATFSPLVNSGHCQLCQALLSLWFTLSVVGSDSTFTPEGLESNTVW